MIPSRSGIPYATPEMRRSDLTRRSPERQQAWPPTWDPGDDVLADVLEIGLKIDLARVHRTESLEIQLAEIQCLPHSGVAVRNQLHVGSDVTLDS